MFVTRTRRPNHGNSRRGAAMFEMAIVLPILLMLLLGIIEMGRVMMINQMATNACREACRQAIIPGATDTQITSVVNGYLDAAGISATGRQVKVMDASGTDVSLDDIGSHETVTVEVQAPYSENTWGFSAIMGGRMLVARSTMRRE